jgi:hypothetical protein
MDERASVRKPGIPIATRTLMWREGERDVPIEVRIYEPEKEGEGAWMCRFEIDWPKGMRSLKMGGFDAVQALVHALQAIGLQIYTSEYHESGNLRWDRPGNGYGFPVMSNVRDLLEGGDKKYL